METTVTLILKGSGLKKDENNSVSGITVFEREYRFENGVEFGKFLGPKLLSDKVSVKESDIIIPNELRYTWGVKRVQGASPELYEDWAQEFYESDIGSRDLTKEDILLYWLQRVQDDDIIELLQNRERKLL
jgi:hypothetical protein